MGRAVLNQKVRCRMCAVLCPVNTEITRISVALDLPEFQWNQLELRVYIDFSEIFSQQTELFPLIKWKKIFFLHIEMYRDAHSYANF